MCMLNHKLSLFLWRWTRGSSVALDTSTALLAYLTRMRLMQNELAMPLPAAIAPSHAPSCLTAVSFSDTLSPQDRLGNLCCCFSLPRVLTSKTVQAPLERQTVPWGLCVHMVETPPQVGRDWHAGVLHRQSRQLSISSVSPPQQEPCNPHRSTRATLAHTTRERTTHRSFLHRCVPLSYSTSLTCHSQNHTLALLHSTLVLLSP